MKGLDNLATVSIIHRGVTAQDWVLLFLVAGLMCWRFRGYPWVSVASRVTRVRCHGDNVCPVSVPFRSVLWVSAEFFWVLRIGNHCMDSVAIRALSMVCVLMFFFFLLYATSCILDRLSRIQSLPLVPYISEYLPVFYS